MGQSNLEAHSIQNKAQFFTHLTQNEVLSVKNIQNRLDFADDHVKSIPYGSILDNQAFLETEFTTLFSVLKRRKHENDEAFWVYCYYCASLLESFHSAYSQKALQHKYAELKKQIKDRVTKKESEHKKTEESFIKSVEKSIVTGFYNLATAPVHLSKIREYVAFSNLCRLYWVFCRLTLTSGLALARDAHIIEQLDAILGTHTDVDKIISVFQAPNGVLNYFSVGLFLARFIIDAGLLVRHTFFPSKEEKNSSAMQRFQYELYKRHGNFVNDLVWATVNFLTNFNHITNIPSPVASGIIAVFLGFDVCMTLYRTYLAKREYLLHKAEMEHEIEQLEAMGFPAKVQKMQLEVLKRNWQAKEAGCYFIIAAAGLFMLGFSGAFLLSASGLVVASFFTCLIAGNMYLASGKYEEYQTKKFALEQEDLSKEELWDARKEFETARNEFMVSMIKNTTIPTVLIATFAVCWPAAVVLSALYISYEIYHAYDQHQAKNEVHVLVLPKDIKENTNELAEEENGSCFVCC